MVGLVGNTLPIPSTIKLVIDYDITNRVGEGFIADLVS
jgi:hypothetical protein